MSDTHFEIPKTAGYKTIGVLVSVIIAICCWGLNRYLADEDKHESKQEARMDVAQQAIIEINSQAKVHVATKDAHHEQAKAPGG